MKKDIPTFSSFSNEVFPDVFDLVVATSALFPGSISFGDCCDEVELVLVRGLHMTLLADEVRPPLIVVRVVEFCFFSGIKSSTKVNWNFLKDIIFFEFHDILFINKEKFKVQRQKSSKDQMFQ